MINNHNSIRQGGNICDFKKHFFSSTGLSFRAENKETFWEGAFLSNNPLKVDSVPEKEADNQKSIIKMMNIITADLMKSKQIIEEDNSAFRNYLFALLANTEVRIRYLIKLLRERGER